MKRMANGTAGTLTFEEREAVLRRVRRFARLMDRAVHVPGTDVEFGIDELAGLVPVVGDAASAIVSCYVPLEAYRLGAPWPLVARMLLNVLVDLAIGAVPVLGDLLDVAWKTNERNVHLMEEWLGV